MIITKKVGRPKKLDRAEVLRKAIDVFWEKGYDGASMKDLTEAMGINSPSLYAEFGDKRGLYLEAIESYTGNNTCGPLVTLENEPDIRKAVRGFFEAAIADSTQHKSGAKGCFLASCVSTTTQTVEGAAELLQSAIASTDKRIARRFDTEIKKGTLPEDFPSLERARLLFDLRQGLVFRARAGVPDKKLLSYLKQKVNLVLGVG
ncbi:TetR/AcrR family transcriptional regulator [Pseudomaricurvus alkylphenolicus]|uniref:TetR/AcrR family transcriptional regulator n=1 Tax=Pseudomaricurvus alkylphenolicus TaxID=1306991 RepID=UPI00197E80C2|nr:TetR/AcrR family transcriptional regulator [Pseudomaricurvus alkylphenolicus]